MIPNNITKEHLEKAIEEIDKNGIRKSRHSSTYDLIYKGENYPPKLVVSIANRFANGSELDPNDFTGGKGTAAFELLKKEGFIINKKVKDKTIFYDILIRIKPKVEELGFKFKSFKENSRYVWIDDQEGIIGNNTAHYEIIARRNKVYVEIHFEDSKNHTFFHSQITNLPGHLKWFKWNKGGQSIRYSEYNIEEKDLHNKLVNDLIDFDKIIGNEIRSLINNLNNTMENDCKMEFSKWLVKNPKADYWNNDTNKIKEALATYNSYFKSNIFNVNANNVKKITAEITNILYNEATNDFLNFSYKESNHRPRAILGKRNYLKFLNGKFSSDKDSDIEKLSLNTILYGPPGTGKTYKLKNEFFEKFTDESSTQTKEGFLEELVENLSWWETIGVALLDLKKAKVNEILEHPFIKVKANQSTNKSIRATLWGQMQVHTIEECKYVNVKDRRAPFIFNKTQNSYWEIVETNVENDIPELIDILSKYRNFKPSVKTRKRYVFTTFHQSFSYEDFIEGIKPIIYEDDNNPENGKQVIYDIKPGLFKQIVKDANADRDNDYAIFIDEINRGNIANIFGELITLIEDDKRIDRANYIPAKLPYSNEDFGVPPNLYIIGTMNTADRSVEALDTALRRRFSFIEMNPEPNKLSSDEFKCDGINLEELLIAINGRIEKLLDKDYCIGHSYFMTIKDRQQPLDELKVIFQNKILPLLQEYFYGDWGKIMLVIGEKFVEKKKDPIKFLSTDSYEDFEEYDEKPIYNFTTPSYWTLDSFKSIYE